MGGYSGAGAQDGARPPGSQNGHNSGQNPLWIKGISGYSRSIHLTAPMSSAPPAIAERRLTLADVLDALVADGIVLAAETARLNADRRLQRSLHPLVTVADQKWKHASPPHKLLTLEWLTEWLRGQVRPGVLPHRPAEDQLRRGHRRHVERLRERFKILPVAVNSKEAVIATCRAVRARVGARAQPHPQARHPPRHRQPARHRALPGRVLQPRQERSRARASRPTAAAGSATSSSWSSWARPTPARRQRPAHRQHRRLAVAVRLRPARQRHPHRAAARDRHRALPHRRRAAPGLPAARGGDGGDDQPHQDPRPHGRGGEAPAAGRPHQDAHRRRAGGRTAPVDAADRVRREAGDADLRSRKCWSRISPSSAFPTRTRRAGTT